MVHIHVFKYQFKHLFICLNILILQVLKSRSSQRLSNENWRLFLAQLRQMNDWLAHQDANFHQLKGTIGGDSESVSQLINSFSVGYIFLQFKYGLEIQENKDVLVDYFWPDSKRSSYKFNNLKNDRSKTVTFYVCRFWRKRCVNIDSKLRRFLIGERCLCKTSP